MSDLVQDMRAVCILAVRSPKDAEGMSSVLQVISAIERIANDAVDIARIVTHQLGIPAQLVADLSDAEEVSHRVLVSRRVRTWRNRPLVRPRAPGAGRDAGDGGAAGAHLDHRASKGDHGHRARRRALPPWLARRHHPSAGAGGGARSGRHQRRSRGPLHHRPRPGRRRARGDEEPVGGRRGSRLQRPRLRRPVGWLPRYASSRTASTR